MNTTDCSVKSWIVSTVFLNYNWLKTGVFIGLRQMVEEVDGHLGQIVMDIHCSEI